MYYKLATFALHYPNRENYGKTNWRNTRFVRVRCRSFSQRNGKR